MNAGLDLRQMMQSMQLKANEKSAAEELKAEEQLQAETVSTQKINIAKASTDLRMRHIHQAAEAGLLRPVWLEMLEMDPDMPRTSDMIRRAKDNKNQGAERAEEAKERVAKSEQVADDAERVVKSEQGADGAERAAKPEQSAKPVHTTDGADAVKTEQAAKPERTSNSAERSAKTEHASNGSRSDVNSSE